MNDFLDKYEIIGGKMKPVLLGETGTEKLDTLRKALGKAQIRDDDDSEEGDDQILMPVDIDEKEDRWDCESILCEYHNRPLRAR